MWLTCSSIGRKLVMAITGACLVLFVTFHCLMNGVALFWPQGYNAVCEFLGANWYALVATVGLAALFIFHIIYALWLTLQNRKARGNDRYKVVKKPLGVEWSSQNMLVLGIVVLAFLVVHMIQFWAKMQLAEILHCDYVHEGVEVSPAAGTLFIQIAFSQVWTPIVYIIGFIALWFHMNHGFWSMFQSCGWDNDTWLPRLKKIACWWTTIVVALFIAEAVVFTVRANSSDFQKELTEYNLAKGSEFALDTDAIECGAKMCGETACPNAVCPQAECPKATCIEVAAKCPEGCCADGVCANPETCANPECKGKN
ncbi:MAG: succinate dehydrogenase cytochrome b subunit [Duncaniella sp.]|nr:succinate dehydrogenase cytochrome b subunit [Duncaniella sp.]